jgi:hypothetical protein
LAFQRDSLVRCIPNPPTLSTYTNLYGNSVFATLNQTLLEIFSLPAGEFGIISATSASSINATICSIDNGCTQNTLFPCSSPPCEDFRFRGQTASGLNVVSYYESSVPTIMTYDNISAASITHLPAMEPIVGFSQLSSYVIRTLYFSPMSFLL